jgi:ketosteroid isomerase-like protein
MYRWLVRSLVPPVLIRITRGRTWLVRAAFRSDAEFVFPGEHSWAADYRSRPQIEAWLRDFAAMRPHYEVLDIVVGGPPWHTRIAIRFRDTIEPGYTNEGMHWMLMRWGRVVHERVFLDTQRVDAWETEHPEARRGQNQLMSSGRKR